MSQKSPQCTLGSKRAAKFVSRAKKIHTPPAEITQERVRGRESEREQKSTRKKYRRKKASTVCCQLVIKAGDNIKLIGHLNVFDRREVFCVLFFTDVYYQTYNIPTQVTIIVFTSFFLLFQLSLRIG